MVCVWRKSRPSRVTFTYHSACLRCIVLSTAGVKFVGRATRALGRDVSTARVRSVESLNIESTSKSEQIEH